MEEKIKQFKELKDSLTGELRLWVADKSVSLEERWKVFIASGFGETSYRTDFGLDRDDEFLYESPLYMSKYEIQPVENILECLKDSEEFELTEEEELIFKNYCLDNFYSKMKFDW
jgi:hypothetical protein